MKKHGLFKSITILLLVLIITTYIIPGRQGEVVNLGLIDVVLNFLQSFYYFFDTGLFLLVVGGLYGVLNQTGAYKKLLDNIVTKLKPNSKNFVIATIIIFALLVSLTGITIPLFIFIPFVISIILLLGYDKLVAFTSTFGAMIIGFIGGIFINFKDPSDSYSVTFTTFEKYLDLDGNFVNIFPKILLLVVGVLLLVFYVLKYLKNLEEKKVKYELNDNEKVQVTEVKADYKKIKTWPLIVILILMFILLILGLMPWQGIFGIKVFEKFNTFLSTKLVIKEFNVMSIFTSQPVAFGNWAMMGQFLMPSFMILFFTLIIKLVYKVKFNDVITDFAEGAKKVLPTVFMLMLAFAVLVCSYNNGFIETIIGYTSKFNVAITSLITILGSLLHIDLFYTIAAVLDIFKTTYTDTSIYPVLAILFQTIYGLVSLVAPTSILLIIGLTYYDIPYTTWLKFIWRLLLKLIILTIAVVLLVTLII